MDFDKEKQYIVYIGNNVLKLISLQLCVYIMLMQRDFHYWKQFIIVPCGSLKVLSFNIQDL